MQQEPPTEQRLQRGSGGPGGRDGKKGRFWANVRGWLWVIGVVLLIRWAWFEPFRIPSASMEPTLHGENDGIGSWLTSDRVAVNKWVYGLRFPLDDTWIPFTDTYLDYSDHRIFKGQPPQRWDIVVFKSDEEESRGRILIKRVVGLPGERVHIADGHVYVNGEPLQPPDSIKDILRYTTAPDDREVRRHILRLATMESPPTTVNPLHPSVKRLMQVLGVLREQLRDRDPAKVTDEDLEVLLEDIDPIAWKVAQGDADRIHAQLGSFRYGIFPGDEYSLVPEGHYFVLGDNSGESRDGRAFGWVPESNILGRTFCIWWPISRWRDFTGFSHTWWGLLLLFGLPIAMVLYEFSKSFIWHSWRVRRGPTALAPPRGIPLDHGDRILVNRIAFGWRLPFTYRRITKGRMPRRGEVVMYAAPGVLREPMLGRVAGLPGDTAAVDNETVRVGQASWPSRARNVPEQEALWTRDPQAEVPENHVLVLSDGDAGEPDSRVLGWIPREHLVGSVVAVWSPWGRRRRIRSAVPTETTE